MLRKRASQSRTGAWRGISSRDRPDSAWELPMIAVAQHMSKEGPVPCACSCCICDRACGWVLRLWAYPAPKETRDSARIGPDSGVFFKVARFMRRAAAGAPYHHGLRADSGSLRVARSRVTAHAATGISSGERTPLLHGAGPFSRCFACSGQPGQAARRWPFKPKHPCGVCVRPPNTQLRGRIERLI